MALPDEMHKAFTHILREELQSTSLAIQEQVHAEISQLLKELRGDQRIAETLQQQSALLNDADAVPSVPLELVRDVNGLRSAGLAWEATADSEAKPPDLQEESPACRLSKRSVDFPELSSAALQQHERAGQKERPLSKYSIVSASTRPTSSSTRPATRPVSGTSQVSAGSLMRHSSLKPFMEEGHGKPAEVTVSETSPRTMTCSQEQPADGKSYTKVRARRQRAEADMRAKRHQLADTQTVPPSLLTSEVSHNFPTKVNPPFGAPPPLPPLPNSPVQLPGSDSSEDEEDYDQILDDDQHIGRQAIKEAPSTNSMKDNSMKALRFSPPTEIPYLERSGPKRQTASLGTSSFQIARNETTASAASKGSKFFKSVSKLFGHQRQATWHSEESEEHVAISFRQEPIKAIVENDVFDYVMGIILCLNAASIGWEVNYKASHIDEATPDYFKVAEICFCVAFTIEVTLRMLAYKIAFLYRKDWQWNVFDSVIVILQIVELLTQEAEGPDPEDSGSGTFEAVSFLKILKFGRVVRLVRMVRFIPSLKSMVYLIAASLGSFFWTIMLMMLLIYGVAIYFTDVVTDYRKARGEQANQEIVDSWGTLMFSVLSLYQAILGGIDWRDLFDPLNKEVSSPLVVLLFLLYIAFATLVMLNLVTGVFVEGAQRIIRQDKDAELVKHVKKLFAKTDRNDDSEITWAEFERRIGENDKSIDDYFKAVDLNRDEARNLFKLLDHDESGSLCADEFVHGCLRLKGPAKSVDLAMHVYNSKIAEARWVDHFNNIEMALLRLIDNMNGEGTFVGAAGDALVTGGALDASE